MQQTSLQAYLTDVRPKLNQKQHEVYRALEEYGPCTNRQLAEYMDRPINTITPRVLELREKRRIYEIYKAEDNGRKAIYWGTSAHKTLFGAD
jgi:DNA-binding MarR family transcriptional regulator